MDEEKNVLYLPPRVGRGPQAIFAALKESAAGVPVAASSEGSSREDTPSLQQVAVIYLPLTAIRTSSMQIRNIDDRTLNDLTNSILERGVIQPILVRPVVDASEMYELIAGERRFRAAKLAGLDTIPALITAVDDRDSLEIAIIENAQREDLNPVEEALAYHRLSAEYGLSQGEIAEAIGKSRVAITNSIRLLGLPEEVLELVKNGDLSAGHGRALLMVKDSDTQLRLAYASVKNSLSVRGLERMVQALLEDQTAVNNETEDQDRAALKRWEERIGEVLKLERVKLRHDPNGHKVVTITFDSEASWRRFMGRMR